MRRILDILLLLLLAAPCGAATWYCDPNGNTSTGDGSFENPWGTLQSVFEAGKIQRRQYKSGEIGNPTAPVAPGDTIKLLDGLHGSVSGYQGWWNLEGAITLEAYDPNDRPSLGLFSMEGTGGWTLRGIVFDHQSFLTAGAALIRIRSQDSFGGTSEYITVEECELFGASHALADTWDEDDWVACPTGIELRANYLEIRDNTIYNVRYGITAGGLDGVVEYNSIDRWAGDGLRMHAYDGMVWQYNKVTDSLGVDTNHDDFFQIYTTAETHLTGLTIRGNWLATFVDPNRPFISSSQGIGHFGNGTTGSVLIENNFIAAGHSHGISWVNATGITVVNNTLIQPIGADYPPSININYSTDVVIENNIGAGTMSGEHDNGTNISFYYHEDDPNDHFVDWQNFDARLIETSTAIDGGSATHAPTIDINKFDRTQVPDIGAWEYGSPAYTHPSDLPEDDPNDLPDPDPEPSTGNWLLFLR